MITDNLAVHKVAGIIDAVEKRGVNILFLPQYSPDFNPIENVWSKIKSRLRALKARTLDAMCDALAYAFSTVTTEHCRNYFEHCGYNTGN